MFGAFAPMPLRLGDDWSAAQHARLCADLVAVKRTLPLARWFYLPGGGVVSWFGFSSMEGSGPTWQPGYTVNGTGDITFAWTDPNFVDAYGIVHPINVRHAIAGVWNTAGHYATVALSYNGVRVRTFTNAGALADVITSVKVW
jgi:hypothetical protein